MDKYRLWGELIVNYIYLVKKGDEKLVCVNYYDNSQVEIPLDLRLTPSKIQPHITQNTTNSNAPKSL